MLIFPNDGMLNKMCNTMFLMLQDDCLWATCIFINFNSCRSYSKHLVLFICQIFFKCIVGTVLFSIHVKFSDRPLCIPCLTQNTSNYAKTRSGFYLPLSFLESHRRAEDPLNGLHHNCHSSPWRYLPCSDPRANIR